MNSIVRSLLLTSALFANGAAQAAEIDTNNFFSFNMGTDVGDPGEKEIQAGFDSRFGRRAGSYSALAGTLSLQYTPARNFQLELSAAGVSHRIENVPGMDDRHATAFGGLSFAATYRLLDREKTGLGLAVMAEPFWARVDDDTGEPINGYGAEFTLAMDKEIVENRLVGVFNVSYAPAASQSRLDATWSHENLFGLSGGLMLRLGDNVFGGIEARYLRQYETLGFSGFAGEAFYLGPSLSVSLSKNAWLTVGWNAQIAGRAANESGALDLTNFSRHEVRLAFGTNL